MGKTNWPEASKTMSRDNKADKKLLLTHLEKTPIVEAACKQMGLPRSTYYRWRKDDEVFASKCDEVIELSIGRINDLAESQLINAIKEKNMSAITFWLKHHHYKYRNRLEIDANLHHSSDQMTDEQSKIVAQALKFAGLLQEQTKDNDYEEPE